jgi:hypothetical protein
MLKYVRFVNVTDASISLMKAYLDSEIVTKKFQNDALHVALSTFNNCSIIVSWNFKHIVNSSKIPLYNAINLVNGYSSISIYSPMELTK